VVESLEREIVELHEFFAGWFRGELEDSAFVRFESVMARDFEMVAPSGVVLGREHIVEGVRGKRGSEGEGFAIEIRDVRERLSSGEIMVMAYEEWQRGGADEAWRGRLSTVVFRARSGAPNGVEWAHVHETWLPAGAEPS